MSSNLKYWYLQNHKLFRNLSFSEINELCILKRFKKSQKNEIIDLYFGDKVRVYFLKYGIIKLIKISEDGEEVLVEMIQKGDIFGELNLMKDSNNKNEFFKVVSDEAIICTFFREKLEEIMIKKPEFALSYIKFTGFYFKKYQNSYKNILFRDTKTRLILLINLIIDKEDINDERFVLNNYLTQKDISQLICTTRQAVISLLKELETDGILEYSQKEIRIMSLKKIKVLVENIK